MALLEIPTKKNLDNYQISIVLESVLYFFDIVYNFRNDRYHINILNSGKEQIVSGLPLLTNVPLTNYFKYLDIPKGDFIVFSDNEENAELGNLGDFAGFYYNEATNG